MLFVRNIFLCYAFFHLFRPLIIDAPPDTLTKKAK